MDAGERYRQRHASDVINRALGVSPRGAVVEVHARGPVQTVAQRPINPLGETRWWVMTNRPVVHYARSPKSHEERMKSGGKRMMPRGTTYRIVVRRELTDKYAVAFEGMEMEAKDGDTALTGEIVDQPHLHGILERINGLGLVLLSVEALPEDTHPGHKREREQEASEL